MLIIAGTFDVDPAERDAFIASREAVMRESRDEVGCTHYVFSADPLEPGRVYLFERWDSKEHLAAHLARLQSGSGADDARAVTPIAADIQQYEISTVGPIGS